MVSWLLIGTLFVFETKAETTVSENDAVATFTTPSTAIEGYSTAIEVSSTCNVTVMLDSDICNGSDYININLKATYRHATTQGEETRF